MMVIVKEGLRNKSQKLYLQATNVTKLHSRGTPTWRLLV